MTQSQKVDLKETKRWSKVEGKEKNAKHLQTSFDFPHHREQSLHDLLIPKADNLQPHLTQYPLPPFIFLSLQIVDVAIDFNDQSHLVTIEVDDESLNDLLPPKVDSQLIRP